MQRRTFLAAAAAAFTQAQAKTAQRVVDTHLHFYDPSRPQGVPWPAKEEKVLYRTVLPAEFEKLTAPYGVTGAIVVEASPWLEDNQWVLDLAARSPIILGMVGHLDPGTSEFRRHLARFHRNPLFRGIRVNGDAISKGLQQKEFLEDLSRLAEADLELDAIGNTAMLPVLVRLTDRLPKLRIVINHLPFDWPSPPPALKELGQRPQVYAKVSGVLRKNGGNYQRSLDELWDAFGPDHVVYGSNWPVSDLVGPYDAVFRVVHEYFEKKGPEAAEKYFWRNSQAAYRWVSR